MCHTEYVTMVRGKKLIRNLVWGVYFCLPLILLALLLIPIKRARAEVTELVLINQDSWVLSGGSVKSVVTGNDGTTYLGGFFTQIGPYVGSFVSLDSSTGQYDNTFPKVVGDVSTVTSDGLGGWYIGGKFSKVGNYERQNLAHILSDKTVDPNWNPNANDTVNTLVINNSIIYAGGWFTTMGGQTRNHLAAINVGGDTDVVESKC